MRKVFIIGFILVIAFSFMNTFQGFSTPATPRIFVDPKDNKFATETTSVGDTFTINISTSDWEAPGLYGYDFKLFFDNTLLNATAVVLPTGHFLTGGLEIVKEIHNEEGYIQLVVMLTGTAPGKTGSGVFATVTFEIIKAPPPTLSCNLEIKEVSLLDPDGNEITDIKLEAGTYEFSAPTPPVYLKVEPATVSAAEIGDEVTLSVTINEMQSALELANVTFKLSYNTTLLSTKEEWITAGETYPYFKAIVEADYVKVEVQMVTGPPFPEDGATLANIKFNATYIPETPTTSPLTLSDAVLKDIDGNTVQFNRLVSGQYQVPVAFEKEDLNGDGKVDLHDVYVFAEDFGSYPGHPRWHGGRADMDSLSLIHI